MQNTTTFNLDRVFTARILIGLGAGLLLSLLHALSFAEPMFGIGTEAWEHLIVAAIATAILLPLVFLFGLGHLPPKPLLIWGGLAGVGLFSIGYLSGQAKTVDELSLFSLSSLCLICLFVIHEFLQSAHDDRTLIARYKTYFDNAWKHGFQGAIACVFIGMLWALLWLCAALFRLIEIDDFAALISSKTFAFSASYVGFAVGVHWSDASVKLTRGARDIALALFSLLLMVLVPLLALYLVALLLKGLALLWDTDQATGLMLSASIALVFLINAAYRDGQSPGGRVLRFALPVASLPLFAVTGLAIAGLWMRVDQYGLTPPRVLVAAALIIMAIYAVGYLAAAIDWRGRMRFMQPVNLFAAAVTAILLLVLLTPLGNPGRLAVADQVARLDKGKTTPEAFDFAFLTKESTGRWGEEALADLTAWTGTERDELIAQLAREALHQQGQSPFVTARRDAIWLTSGAEVPDAALRVQDSNDPLQHCSMAVSRMAPQRGSETLSPPGCPARLIDMDFDGDEDLLIWMDASGGQHSGSFSLAVMLQQEDGSWISHAGIGYGDTDHAYHQFPSPDGVPSPGEMMAIFETMTPVPADRSDLSLLGHRVRLIPAPRTSDRDAMRDLVKVLGDGAVPRNLPTGQPFENLLGRCQVPEPSNQRPEKCFGRYADIDGDGTEEFLLIALNTLFDELTIHAHAEGPDEDWRVIATRVFGFSSSAIRLANVNDVPPQEWLARHVEQSLEQLTIIQPVLADIDARGERLVLFDFEPEKL